MTDREIVDLCLRRDETALELMQNTYGNYCYSIAFRILSGREDSEECVNETWLRAWESIPPQEPKNLKMFLAAVTRNLAFDIYRRKRTQKRGGGEIEAVLEELQECVAGEEDPEQKVIAKDLGAEIDRFLQTLSEKERDVFLRRYFFAEPTKMIAKRFCQREANIRMILSRTREKLKKHLYQEGYMYEK